MSTQSPSPFLSVAELALALHLSRARVYQLVRDGEVPVTRFGGVIRVPRAALEAWFAEREQEALDSVRRKTVSPTPVPGESNQQ